MTRPIALGACGFLIAVCASESAPRIAAARNDVKDGTEHHLNDPVEGGVATRFA